MASARLCRRQRDARRDAFDALWNESYDTLNGSCGKGEQGTGGIESGAGRAVSSSLPRQATPAMSAAAVVETASSQASA